MLSVLQSGKSDHIAKVGWLTEMAKEVVLKKIPGSYNQTVCVTWQGDGRSLRPRPNTTPNWQEEQDSAGSSEGYVTKSMNPTSVH